MTRPEKTMIAALLVSGAVLAGFLAMIPEGKTGLHRPYTEGTAMAGGNEAEAAREPAAIPPIDALHHPVTETATFSMG